MARPVHTQVTFDAMSDSQFTDWWDAWHADAQANAETEEEFDDADERRSAAFERRWPTNAS